MSTKTHRGKTLWKIPSRGRGTCPLCKTQRIKILYEIIAKDGTKISVCKRCQYKKLNTTANL